TPATVIGLLTILGFSLYDTVIVFDKVEENTHGFQHTSRRTFAEHANLAVNQTFMRSINTSLISAIPVLSLIVVAIWLLGVGTLKDLALVQLVGILVGTYSSIFFATPLLVALRERTDLVAGHTKKVLSRRKPDAAPLADTGSVSKAAKVATRIARIGAIATTVLLATGLLTSCWTSAAKTLDYAVDGRLITYNVNSVAGNASAGAQAFNRVLTGFGFHGPDGQVIADHDFGSVEVVGRIPLVLDYTINEKAVYSDGKPVTCEDMVLSWFAQSGRLPDFDAASTAGYADISTVDCKPGQKTARVTFAPDRAFTDWTQLFTATTMLPWHVIADKLGGNIDLIGAIAANDVPTLEKIADFWNN
ncbi:Protein translocase subunit SecF, partial [Aduncisulcus paluster]